MYFREKQKSCKVLEIVDQGKEQKVNDQNADMKTTADVG